MIEDDFYGTIKFKNGEEIFAKVAASEEEDRTMLIVHTPVMVSEVKAKGGLIGYKVEPWLKTSREDMFIINMDNILTLSFPFLRTLPMDWRFLILDLEGLAKRMLCNRLMLIPVLKVP